MSGAPWLPAAQGHVVGLKKCVADEQNGNMNSGSGGSWGWKQKRALGKKTMEEEGRTAVPRSLP